jgi:hypothetical protein
MNGPELVKELRSRGTTAGLFMSGTHDAMHTLEVRPDRSILEAFRHRPHRVGVLDRRG